MTLSISSQDDEFEDDWPAIKEALDEIEAGDQGRPPRKCSTSCGRSSISNLRSPHGSSGRHPRSMDDLLTQVFPGFFDPANSIAAMQFSLNAAICNDQLPMLLTLIDRNTPVVAVEGDPGWTIEHRKAIGDAGEYAAWPALASFRAYLDPDAYSVCHPECYMSQSDFLGCLRQLLGAYTAANPQLRSDSMNHLLR